MNTTTTTMTRRTITQLVARLGGTTTMMTVPRGLSTTSSTTSSRLATLSTLSCRRTTMTNRGFKRDSSLIHSAPRWMSSTSTSTSNTDATEKEEDNIEEETTPTEEETTTTEDQGQEEEEEEPKQDPIPELETEIQTLKDQLLRALAEQENIRQIARRDVAAAKQFSIKGLAKSLLEVADNLQRALAAVPASEIQANADNNSLSHLYEGIQMTQTGLIKALQSHGVEAYCETPGDVFDPTVHEALMEYPDETKTPGTVGQVIKCGYTLNGRVLRPAEVGVVKK